MHFSLRTKYVIENNTKLHLFLLLYKIYNKETTLILQNKTQEAHSKRRKHSVLISTTVVFISPI